jgi:hypothetical protein
MAYVERHRVEITTAADGSAVAFSPVVNGYLQAIHYLKAVSGGFADGVDFAVTAEATGETLWAESDVNASASRAPRQATHSTSGVAAVYASGGSAVNDRIALAVDRVRIAVTNGGDAKSGSFIILVG